MKSLYVPFSCVQEFSVGGVVEGDSEEVMGRMGQLEDMRAEWHQRKTMEHYVHRAPPELFGVETVRWGMKTIIETQACCWMCIAVISAYC